MPSTVLKMKGEIKVWRKFLLFTNLELSQNLLLVSIYICMVQAAITLDYYSVGGCNLKNKSIHVAERLALPSSDHGVACSNPAGGKIRPEPKRRFIAQSLSCSPFHRLEMTAILLKGVKLR